MTDIITAAQNPEQGDVGENRESEENRAHKSPAATQGLPSLLKFTEYLRNDNDSRSRSEPVTWLTE